MKKKFISILIINLLISIELMAQNNWGPNQTDYRRELHKDQHGTVYGDELAPLNTTFMVGRESGPIIWRDVYQWNIPDEEIPDNSTINLVRLVFDYTDGSTSSDLYAIFYKISHDMTSEDYFAEIFLEMHYSFGPIASATGTSHNITYESSDPNGAFNKAIKDMLPNNKFVLGIKWGNDTYNNNNNWFINNASVKLYVEYTSPIQTVAVNQKLSNNSNIDSVGLWNSSEIKFENFLVPGSFSWETSSYKTLRGSQKLLSNQKYIHWENNSQADNNVVNHKTFQIIPTTTNLTSRFNPANQGVTIQNSLEGTQIHPGTDSIRFADPWYIDYVDSDYADSMRNRGMKATGSDAIQYRPRQSPFYPDLSTLYQNENDPSHAYLGVFLNQPYTGDNPVYYSVQAIDPQSVAFDPPIGERNFYFQYWDGAGVNFQSRYSNTTPVVFTSSNAVASAVLKGQGLSDDDEAFSSNGQRKIVKTDDGYLHSVYRSMGRIWYEISSDGGTTWNLLNGGVPLADGDNQFVGTPSIDYAGNYTVVAYQTLTDGLLLKFFKGGGNPYTYSLYGTLTDNNITTDQECFPVVAINGQIGGTPASFMVVLKVSNLATMTTGLYCRYGKFRTLSPYDFYWVTGSQLISNASITTDASSNYPSLTNKKIHNSSSSFNLVWQQGYNDINYCKLRFNGSSVVFEAPAVISETDGFTYNMFPSVSMAAGDSLIFSWVGHNGTGIEKSIGKGNGFSQREETKIVVKRGILGNFFNGGSNVHFVNNNSTSSGGENSVILWSEGNPVQSKWILRSGASYTSTVTLGRAGIQSQLSNGSNLSGIKAMVYNTSETPYYFSQASEDFSDGLIGDPGTGKIASGISLTYGKSGIVNKSGVQFVFNIGDIVLEDTTVQFVPVPDTILYTNTDELNEVMRSMNFHLDNQSQLYFTDFYYTVNPELADSVLTEADFVTFKAELVNAGTNTVAGTYDEVTYTKNNIDEYDNVNYQVDCSGIPAGDYYLRLVTTISGNAEYNLANVQNDDPGLDKRNYKTVQFDGSIAPATYDLSQNYPNPFNPATTINYQLPQTGFVTLKIYDILGKEVAMLVNEQKNQGRYSVNFNASRLASGVYIYQLRVNDYVSSKKMLLIK